MPLMLSPEVNALLSKANREHLAWEKFRFQPMPQGLDPKLAWALLKFARQANLERLPLEFARGRSFSFSLTKPFLLGLRYVDTHGAGVVASHEAMPSGPQKDRMVINGLIEEAISSSQIEGANTTRKAAKAMIESQRAPKNRDERMVLNNFLAMERLEEWKDRPLDEAFLLELHRVLTQGTLEDPGQEGRFRHDADDIVVLDKMTGEAVHVPPKEEEMRRQLKQLCTFANANDDDEIHPFVKASVLHFSLAYIHPFADGNGRSARALFYWYLLRKNYWMFKFLPISLQIKKKGWRPGYDRAFQHVETDEGDLTYFLLYKLRLARNAIEDFIQYIQKKQKEASALKQRLIESETINPRQLELIHFMQKNPTVEMDLRTHQDRNRVVYETARTDLSDLVKKGILKQARAGKKFIFVRGERFPSI